MGKPTPASRRAAELAARQAAARTQQRRRMVLVGLGIALGITLAALAGWWWNRGHQPEPVAPGSQVRVPGTTADGAGITLHATPAGKPTVVVYEDYQCPWCKVAHDELGPLVDDLAARREIGVQVRSLDLIDTMAGNDASRRANVAASCAAVQGRYAQYRDQVFAHQPQHEGDGFDDHLLRDELPGAAGVPDAAAFARCYDQRATHDAVERVLEAARQAGRDGSSPQYWVAGPGGEPRHQLDLQALMGERTPSRDELLVAIKAAS